MVPGVINGRFVKLHMPRRCSWATVRVGFCDIPPTSAASQNILAMVIARNIFFTMLSVFALNIKPEIKLTAGSLPAANDAWGTDEWPTIFWTIYAFFNKNYYF